MATDQGHDFSDRDAEIRQLQTMCLEGAIDRRRFIRRMATIGGAVTATSVFAPLLPRVYADAPATPSASPVRGGTLRYGQDLEPSPENPISSPWMDDANQQMYEYLIVQAPNGQFVPQLAHSYSVSPDKLTWTFQLKRDKTFHDGIPFNAAAAKWFFDTIRDPKVGNPFIIYWAAVATISTPGPYTLVFHLKHPDANLRFAFGQLFAGVVGEAAWSKYHGAAYNLSGNYGIKGAAGTGPFMLKEYVAGDHVTIMRNPTYRDPVSFITNNGTAYLDGVRYQWLPDAATRAIELESGHQDIVHAIAPADIDRLKRNPKLRIITLPAWQVVWLGFNHSKAPMKELAFRQAVSYAIDKKAIVQSVLLGFGNPAFSFVMRQAPEYWPGSERYYNYNPNKAKQLLGGKTYTVDLLTTTTSEDKQNTEIIQAELGQIGIKVKPHPVDKGTYFGLLSKGSFDMFLFPYVWNNANIISLFTDSANIPSPDFMRYKNPEVDRLFTASREANSPRDIIAAYYKIQKILLDQAAMVPLYTPLNVWGVNKRVQGFAPYTWQLYAYLQDVWLAH
jgi:peptide/nickel transport system substrate-binding protein